MRVHRHGIAIGSLLAIVPAFLVSMVVPDMSPTFQDAWSKIVTNMSQVGPINFVHFLRDEVLLSSYFARGSYAIPATYALSLFGPYWLYRVREDDVQLVLSWMMVASLGILVVPRVEQWRLLYMMPMEVLAAEGVIYIVTSTKLLKGSCVADGGRQGVASGNAVIRRPSCVWSSITSVFCIFSSRSAMLHDHGMVSVIRP